MATMTVYDCSVEWNALGRNPMDTAEFDPMITEPNSTLLGTRPIMSLYGIWDDNQAVGFDLTDYEYIGMVIDYGTITITEDDTYEFDIDSDDYGELWVDDTLVAYEVANTCTTIPIALTAGTYTFVFKFQNGTGAYGFALRWRKQGDVTYVPIPEVSVGLTPSVNIRIEANQIDGVFVDYPHKLTIKTQLDDEAVQRRVEIRNRTSGVYIASMLTNPEGVAAFRQLPPQAIDEPHIITCFDDRTEGFLNALVYDRVFQVSDQGFPPEN